eukprot:5753227-Pleurochrysis_carterae.AAC.2
MNDLLWICTSGEHQIRTARLGCDRGRAQAAGRAVVAAAAAMSRTPSHKSKSVLEAVEKEDWEKDRDHSFPRREREDRDERKEEKEKREAHHAHVAMSAKLQQIHARVDASLSSFEEEEEIDEDELRVGTHLEGAKARVETAVQALNQINAERFSVLDGLKNDFVAMGTAADAEAERAARRAAMEREREAEEEGESALPVVIETLEEQQVHALHTSVRHGLHGFIVRCNRAEHLEDLS